MIRLERVGKRYPNGNQALHDVSFELPAGELTFLTGHSGAGKSTLLKLLMCIEKPSSGSLYFGGQRLDKLGRRQIPYLRRNIGMVHQNHQLLFDRSVHDNIALPLLVTGQRRDVERRVRAALDKVGLLHKEHRLPEQLSGGEQQRIGIARAIVNKPPLVLADEPTGNLDPALSAEIMDLFQAFAEVGTCVLIATHDLSLIARYQHRLLTLRQGQLIVDERDGGVAAHG